MIIKEYHYQSLPAHHSEVLKSSSLKNSPFFHFSIGNLENCDRVLNRVQFGRLTGYSAQKLSHSIALKPDAVPKQFSPRKVPLALQAQAKAQLNEMLDDGVIERVTEPSAWLHPMQIAFKPNGRLCLCMDPRYLNQFLERAIQLSPG
jgi:hypothetical protein